MVFGQCEVEQRARRLIFNSAQQHSAGLTLGQRLFPQCIYSERPVPPVSSELFSQGGLNPGWEAWGGVGCGRDREMGGESRQTWGRALPAVPRAARASWEGGGPAPQRAALPACSSWEDAPRHLGHREGEWREAPGRAAHAAEAKPCVPAEASRCLPPSRRQTHPQGTKTLAWP